MCAIMSYLIVGKNGFIATRLINCLQSKGKEYSATTRSKCIADNEYILQLDGEDCVPDSVLQECKNVLFLAAVSSPDVCKKEYDLAYSINVSGSARFIQRCLDNGARVLFFSSDTVYGPTTEPADEKCLPNPVGVYAHMKRELESMFEGKPGFCVARMSYVIAADDKYTKYLTSCCNAGEEAEVFHPMYRSPIWVDDVIEASIAMFEQWGTISSSYINLAGQNVLSRVDLADLYKSVVNEQLKYKVITPPDSFYQARPERIVLRSLYLKQLLGRRCLPISKALHYEFHNINEN